MASVHANKPPFTAILHLVIKHDLLEDLVRSIEIKDRSTAAHTYRVVLYTRALLEDVGAPLETIRVATQGAALHDIGKLDIPDNILQKPDRLTSEEFEVIQQHTITGYARMIDLNIEDETILDLVRYHHERWDGLGYPFRIRGNDIPEIARYFAVIDTFDALTSFRPYRKDTGPEAAERAILELKKGSGTRYWPRAAEAFIDLYRRGSLAYILDYYNDEKAPGRFTLEADTA